MKFLLLGFLLLTGFVPSYGAPSAATSQIASVGFNAHPAWNLFVSSDEDVQNQVRLIKTTHAKVMRLNMGWTAFEWVGRGTSYWYAPTLALMDSYVNQLNQAGIDVIGTLSGAPCWASSDPVKNCTAADYNYTYDRTYPPQNMTDFAAFARDVAAHFKGRVKYWEIWNEPNYAAFWKNPSAGGYLAMLQAAYPAIKASDPSALVVGGAVAPLVDQPALGIEFFNFLNALYAEGANAYFDRLSVHLYANGEQPTYFNSMWPEVGFSQVMPKVRQAMLLGGDSRPLLITETGYTTVNPITCSDCFSADLAVTEQQQATYLAETVQLARSSSYVEAIALYQLIDPKSPIKPGSDGFDDHFGVFGPTGTPKLAAAAVTAAIDSVAISASASGTLQNLALSVNLQVDAATTGTLGNLYVVAYVPAANAYYALTPTGWSPLATDIQPYAQGVVLGTHSIPVLTGDLDLRGLGGALIYVGYGTSTNDLLNNKKYGLAYTL
jgi:hypothetical protein